MTDAADDLPEVLARVAEAAGTAAMLRFAAAFGGVRIKVPRRPGPDTALARAVGPEAARAIVRLYGGSDVTVPLGPNAAHRKVAAAIRHHLEAGESAARTARAVGCHELTVRRHRRRRREQAPAPLLERMKG